VLPRFRQHDTQIRRQHPRQPTGQAGW